MFDFLFKQAFCDKVRVGERLLIWRIWRAGARGLALCREDRFEEATGIFARAWRELDEGRISEVGRLVTTPPLESAHAYFEYKQGDFEAARSRIVHAMDLDLRLEREHGFVLLELHRLQSAQNLMRIDLRAGEERRAMHLAGQILAYTEGLRENLSVHRSWLNRQLCTKTPHSVRRAFFLQVAREVAVALTTLPEARLEEDLFSGIHIESYLASRRVLHQQFRRWLQIKQAFYARSWPRYLELLLEFLPAGRSEIQPIWYASVLDFLTFCREVDDPISRTLHGAILKDAPRWLDLPQTFRSALPAA